MCLCYLCALQSDVMVDMLGVCGRPDLCPCLLCGEILLALCGDAFIVVVLVYAMYASALHVCACGKQTDVHCLLVCPSGIHTVQTVRVFCACVEI